MSAKSAAAALITNDATVAEQVRKLFQGRAGDFEVLAEDKAVLLRELAGTWTLALAAQAADVEEKQVLVAFARFHLKGGTTPACQGLVEFALSNRI